MAKPTVELMLRILIPRFSSLCLLKQLSLASHMQNTLVYLYSMSGGESCGVALNYGSNKLSRIEAVAGEVNMF